MAVSVVTGSQLLQRCDLWFQSAWSDIRCVDLGGTSRLLPAECAAGFRSGFGRDPGLGLKLKFVSKLTEACVLGFCFQTLRSEKREGIRLKLGGRVYLCAFV